MFVMSLLGLDFTLLNIMLPWIPVIILNLSDRAGRPRRPAGPVERRGRAGSAWQAAFLSLAAAQAFRDRHKDIVVKPLYGNAGAAVFRVAPDDGNLPALVEMFTAISREPFIVQAFLAEVAAGDKRIVLIDGEPVGAINRLPKRGEIRSNLAAGGAAERTALTAREQAICDRLGPDLKRMGLMFAGIDVIGGRLTEINVTSPTGIRAIDAFNGTNIPAIFWDRVEVLAAAR